MYNEWFSHMQSCYIIFLFLLRFKWCRQKWICISALEIHLGSSKIYIQFTIFNTYFLTKLSFTNKRYHLHVLEKRLYVLQEVRSIIYFQQFIHPLFLHSRGNGISFVFRSYSIVSVKFCDILFLNNFYFVSFFYHLFICRC